MEMIFWYYHFIFQTGLHSKCYCSKTLKSLYLEILQMKYRHEKSKLAIRFKCNFIICFNFLIFSDTSIISLDLVPSSLETLIIFSTAHEIFLYEIHMKILRKTHRKISKRWNKRKHHIHTVKTLSSGTPSFSFLLRAIWEKWCLFFTNVYFSERECRLSFWPTDKKEVLFQRTTRFLQKQLLFQSCVCYFSC